MLIHMFDNTAAAVEEGRINVEAVAPEKMSDTIANVRQELARQEQQDASRSETRDESRSIVEQGLSPADARVPFSSMPYHTLTNEEKLASFRARDRRLRRAVRMRRAALYNQQTARYIAMTRRWSSAGDP